MFGIPVWIIGIWLFGLGAIFGSFLDVFALRFHTGRSINGRSHCLSCSHTLSWYELFPLFSYLFLRGRCRVCHAKIPTRLFLMEVITGCLFLLVFWCTNSWPELLLGLLITVVAIVIILYDMRHLIIPNTFVIAMGVVAVAVLLFTHWPITSIGELIPPIFSGLVAASFYALLWLVSKGTWLGLGDAKLALPLGIMLTAQETFSFVVLSFWVGALVSLSLIVTQLIVQRGQSYLQISDIPLTMKSEVPFAPFLLIAFALVYFFQIDVLNLFAFAI